MGLFDKKYCDVCGNKIGLLGNRKLEDGNLCKDCARNLSPWFDERRHSTVEQIKAQLDYREENKQAVSAFHTTRTIGRNCKVYLDEDAGKFMVTSATKLADANPDVLDFTQVTGCDLDIQEDRDEEMREVKKADGSTERVSYNPPRYTYSYDFYIQIRVNAPYFDDIRFKLNNSTVEVHQMSGVGMNRPINSAGQGTGILGSVLQGLAGAVAQNTDPRMQNIEYAEYYNMGQEIKEALTSIRTQVREDIAAAAAPKAAVTCPLCGATTTPDVSGKCEYCGGAING